MLADFFEGDRAPSGGELFVGYPITTAAEGRRPIDAVYVSPDLGVIVFDVVEGGDLGDYGDRQDDAATRLEVRLKQHNDLVQRRKLRIPIHAVTFAPGARPAEKLATDKNYPVAATDNLGHALAELDWEDRDGDIYRRAISALQSISGIRRSVNSRLAEVPDSRGSILKRLEGSIATLDSQQSRAVIETAHDVQRIRGLAGSGKTIVLALKAAYLHAQHPDWRIAVTFNTRSLRDQFRRLINNFTIEQTGDEPDWSKVNILPSWGAPGGEFRDGVYHRFCVANGVTYRDFSRAKHEFGSDGALGGACRAALAEATSIRTSFDVILVDEAQDLPIEFLRMCYEMLGTEKRLVYAYDELQTLNGTGLPPAESIFGADRSGNPRVWFDRSDPESARRDIILEKCYRNSRPLLVTAHALGFGVYRTPPSNGATGLVQIFEQKELWDDIGYRVVGGRLQEGKNVTLARTSDSSPPFLEDHSPIDDLVTFTSFSNSAEQAEWLAEQIQTNLGADELVANDIIVINPDPFTTRANLGIVRRALFDRGIDSHIAGVDTSADVFFRSDSTSVTFTGVYRAKGNEAGMVYVANAHESLTGTANLARVRNRLFTAITRSKAWVSVTGIGPEMDQLIEEYERVKANDFKLSFRYPSEAERTTLQILHRDVSKTEEKRLKQYGQSLSDLLSDLESGEVYAEDLDPATRQRLAKLLQDDKE